MTAEVTATFVWNAQSETKTGGSVSDLYDGKGNSIDKSGQKFYWYEPDGQAFYEPNAPGSTSL
jgi:hypothetical protein